VVERTVIVATGRRLHIPPPPNGEATRRGETLADVEREHIAAVLADCGWRIQGRGGAAARLGLTPRALERKIAHLGVQRSPE
jgi:transcriptional regulator with GAF, ATPase, and Fis domain